MSILKKYTFLLAFVALCSTSALAQPEDPDAPTPFGLVEVLIGAGAIYGGKKAYDKRKKNQE